MPASGIAEESEALAVPSGVGAITVRISGLRNSDGSLSVGLFSAKKGFPGKFDKAVEVLSVSASAEPVVVFDNVPWGTYAVAVRHDENGNGKLDANFLGMPKEGVGTSNNPKSSFGPPSFKDASFMLEEDNLDLSINLKYL
ncbi:MAG TPA: DUF2141 domain-containing protein [Chlorobaculum parvum]|uniref:DUF2141 domain-containing protein n=1 Tax=Chlorobaculum parvum TaxID=274539 RepID=A0A7C5DG80_9CHLB|nr:DUF2141 domain-containing protein [Chlorobaculum parvum]